MFIEPSTGQICNPKEYETSNLYLGVESVWNEFNYWVNMQDCSEACSKIDWNLSDPKLWEHLLAGEPPDRRNISEETDEEDDESAKIRREFHMLMPVSYVSNKIKMTYYGNKYYKHFLSKNQVYVL